MIQRDPVRPFLGFLTFVLLYYVGLELAIPVVRFLGGEMTAITLTPLLISALANALLFAMFEQRSLTDAGLQWTSAAARNLITGIALAAVAAAMVSLLPVAFGQAYFQADNTADTNWRAGLFTPLLLFCGAAGEELLFRGFPLQFLMRGYGQWPAIIAIGILFGVLHSGNPNSTGLGLMNTAGFGILFGAALLRSRDLWLPLGLHFGWNAALPYLGTELSGLTIRVVGYKLVWHTGTLWSGGNYGPEGSLLTTGVLALLAVAIWKVPVRRQHLFLLDEAESSLPEALPPA